MLTNKRLAQNFNKINRLKGVLKQQSASNFLLKRPIICYYIIYTTLEGFCASHLPQEMHKITKGVAK
jgi:hypothetical protein